MNKYKELYLQSQLETAGLIAENNMFKRVNPYTVRSAKTKSYEMLLRARDLAMCSTRYELTLPINMTSQQIESMLYRWGSLILYDDAGHLMISRYATTGHLNPYGMLDEFIPIDFSGKTHDIKLNAVSADGSNEQNENVAIILNDYTPYYGDLFPVARSVLNADTTIGDEVLVYTQLRTNVELSVKKALALCDSEEQAKVISSQVRHMLDPETPIVPISSHAKGKNGNIELPVELWNFDNNFDTQNYCQQIDFYDKVRRNFNGVPSPDTFEKKERKITAESEDNNTHSDLMLIDGYNCRKSAFDLAKRYLKCEGIETLDVKICDALESNRESDTRKEYPMGGEDIERDA